MVDWKAGPVSIEFDVSRARSTKCDWIDVWLTPWNANMALPLDTHAPDLNGPPRKGLRFVLTNNFGWEIFSNPREIKISKLDWRELPVPFSGKQRNKFTITIGDGLINMQYRNPATGVVALIDRIPLPPALGFDRAVGQFDIIPTYKDCNYLTIGQ